MLSSTRKNRLNGAIKVVIFIGLGVVLYHQVFKNQHFADVIKTFRESFQARKAHLLILTVLLMGVNWFIEAVKWKMLIDQLRYVSWLKVFKGILFGITFSLFTPNRIGEFGGRVMAFKHNRLPALVATLVGSFSQVAMNLSLGATALMVYLVKFSDIDFFLKVVFAFFYMLLLLAISFIYYNLDIVGGVLLKVPTIKKMKNHLNEINRFSINTLFTLQWLSGFRYLIYSVQYLALIKFFGVKIGTFEGLILVSCIFFVQTIMPSLAIVDIALRSSIAIFFLDNFTQSELGVGIATFSLWLINLIIPGILGALAALTFRFIDSEEIVKLKKDEKTFDDHCAENQH